MYKKIVTLRFYWEILFDNVVPVLVHRPNSAIVWTVIPLFQNSSFSARNMDTCILQALEESTFLSLNFIKIWTNDDLRILCQRRDEKVSEHIPIELPQFLSSLRRDVWSLIVVVKNDFFSIRYSWPFLLDIHL